MRAYVYKILPAADWEMAKDRSDGVVPWAPIDHQDGFLHLSAADQVRETAAKHFAGRTGLCLLEIPTAAIPNDILKWEPSRGGALFPHAHGQVPAHAVARSAPLPWADTAGFSFPDWPGLDQPATSPSV